MSKSSRRMCDVCKKESQLPAYKETGWITFNYGHHQESVSVTYTDGNVYVNHSLEGEVDFCSLKCFEAFLKLPGNK